MKPAVLGLEAAAEASDAAIWYDSKREGLGSEFLNELSWVLRKIEKRPRTFPRLLGPAPELEIRRALLPRFP